MPYLLIRSSCPASPSPPALEADESDEDEDDADGSDDDHGDEEAHVGLEHVLALHGGRLGSWRQVSGETNVPVSDVHTHLQSETETQN